MVMAVAVVDAPETLHRFALFEDVAQSHGFNLRLFGDIDRATEWLTKQPVELDASGGEPALHGHEH